MSATETPKKMKGLVVKSKGAAAVWSADLQVPEPQPGFVRVKIHAASPNPVDFKLVDSQPDIWTYPHVCGLDGAGEIDKIGQNVNGWKVGDRVVFHNSIANPHGTFAEYATCTAHTLALIPAEVSYADAAALPCAGLTAYQTLHRRFHLRKGCSILVTAGSGGVGSFGVQLAKAAGLRVLTTCSPSSFAFVKSLGADEVIDYTQGGDISARVRSLTGGRGVEYAMDCVSSDSATDMLSALAFAGELACVSGAPQRTPNFWLGQSIHGVALGAVYSNGTTEMQAELGKMLTELLVLLKAGHLKIPRDGAQSTMPLAKALEALSHLRSRHQRGKLILTV